MRSTHRTLAVLALLGLLAGGSASAQDAGRPITGPDGKPISGADYNKLSEAEKRRVEEQVAGRSSIRELGFAHEHPRRIHIGSKPNGMFYWYIPFTLTNHDSAPHRLFLEVWAESDKDVHYRSLDQPVVLEKIKKRRGMRPYAHLWSQPDFTTTHEDQPVPPGFPRVGDDSGVRLRQATIPAGETVQCVAIFRGYDREMDRLSISFRGLVNDIELVETGSDHERKTRQRVLVLRYERLGDEFAAHEDPVEYVGREWITVETPVKTDLD